MEAAIAARMLAASGIDEDDSEDVEEAANDAAALEYGFAMRHGAAAPTLTVSRLDRTAQLPAIVEDAPSPADPFVVWSAALRGDVATLESALRAAPQDVHWVGTRGWSALYAACARGHTDAVAALLRHGADPEVARHPREGQLVHGRAVPRDAVRAAAGAGAVGVGGVWAAAPAPRASSART